MTNDEPPDLPIHGMAQRHPGLSEAAAAYLVEALRVCLDRHHTSPTTFAILTEDGESSTRINWESADQTMQASHRNELDATRDGAYACVIAALELVSGLVVISQAWHGSGADFYVAPPNTDRNDLELLTRLEVSGIDHGSQPLLAARVREKLEQLAAADPRGPGIAGVALFSERWVRFAEMEQSP